MPRAPDAAAAGCRRYAMSAMIGATAASKAAMSPRRPSVRTGIRHGIRPVGHDRVGELREALDGKCDHGLEAVDEFERDGGGVGLRFDRQIPVRAPLPLDRGAVVVLADRCAARRDAPQVRQLLRKADAEHLAQIQCDEDREGGVLADDPLRCFRRCHAAILGTALGAATGCVCCAAPTVRASRPCR